MCNRYRDRVDDAERARDFRALSALVCVFIFTSLTGAAQALKIGCSHSLAQIRARCIIWCVCNVKKHSTVINLLLVFFNSFFNCKMHNSELAAASERRTFLVQNASLDVKNPFNLKCTFSQVVKCICNCFWLLSQSHLVALKLNDMGYWRWTF